MIDRKVKKLPLVGDDGALMGLITATRPPASAAPAVRDSRRAGRGSGSGAAIGATGDYLERAAELVHAGVDVIVIDIAHGHSVVMAEGDGGVPQALRGRRDDCRQRCDGRRRDRSCVERGADGIKVESVLAAAARRA